MEIQEKIVNVFISLYSFVWSAISLLKFYSFNATVFDLGVNVGYATYSISNLTLSKLLHVIAYKGIVYFLVPLIYAFSFQGLLIFQSFFLGLGAYPVYKISKATLKDSNISLILAGSYLLYYPLAGVNWFDFHYQALFPTLFLFGYWFYISNRKLLSLFLMALSAITHYPYTVFPFMFALMLALSKKRREDSKVWIPLLILTSAIFLLNIKFYGPYYAIFGIVVINYNPNYLISIFTLFLILAPLLFLPLTSKWALYLTPFIALIFLSSYDYYHYPSLFQSQYSSLYIPFVFLGAIDGLKFLERKGINLIKIVAILFIVVIAFAVAFQPYSPLNSYTPVNYNFGEIFNVNLTQYNQLMKLLSLIPKGSSILISNNVPEAFYPYYELHPYTYWLLNPEQIYNGSVEYILAGPVGTAYTQAFPPSSISMDYLVENASKLGYGLYAEAYGMMLLKYNYTGPVVYYYPLQEYISASSFDLTFPWFYKDGMIVIDNAQSVNIFSGPKMLLGPGSYAMIVFVKSSTNLSTNKMSISVYADDLTKLVAVYYIQGSMLKNGWNQIEIFFTVDKVYANLEIIGYVYNWEGELYIKGIYINQTGILGSTA